MIAVCPQMRVVHLPEPKAIGIVAILRPKRAFRPRSGQKIARVSAQYKNRIANQRSVRNSERTSSAMDEACRLRRDEGLREAPRAQALRRAIGLAERMQSEASLGVCEDEPPEAQLRCRRINGSPVNSGKRADVHPQGVGRIRSAPSSLTAALAIGPYRVLCMNEIGRVFRK